MDISNVLSLFGGLGAFLFGMHYMGEGLQLAAGSKMKDLLEKLTRVPVMGFLVGMLVTVCIQSSSATTVMAMGFIRCIRHCSGVHRSRRSPHALCKEKEA